MAKSDFIKAVALKYELKQEPEYLSAYKCYHGRDYQVKLRD